jgi:hypothetical protein
MDVAFSQQYVDHLPDSLAVYDEVDWRALWEAPDTNDSQKDAAVLDSNVFDCEADFKSFLQFDEEEDDMDKVSVSSNASSLEAAGRQTKTSIPPQDGCDGSIPQGKRCEPHDNEALRVPPGGTPTNPIGSASPQPLELPHQAASLRSSPDSEQSSRSPGSHLPVESPAAKDLEDPAANVDPGRTRKRSSRTSFSPGATRAKRRRRRDDLDADTEYFPSRRQKRARMREESTRSRELLDSKNCLRVHGVTLTIDEERRRYEWNRHSGRWEWKDDPEVEPTSSEVMKELFAQPGTDFLHVWVRVDDQSLEFEWKPEDGRWETEDISGNEGHLNAGFMREMISKPVASVWADVFSC